MSTPEAPRSALAELAVGTVLTAADPEPPQGTVVLCCGEEWANFGQAWESLDPDGNGRPEYWQTIAGNRGPVTVIRFIRRRCASEACDEYDGIHCYGDGCAMASRRA